MASRDVTGAGGGRAGRAASRLSTETKQFFKTSEWWIYVVVVLAILIAGNSIESDGSGGDYFAADKVWLYITILTPAICSAGGSPRQVSRNRTRTRHPLVVVSASACKPLLRRLGARATPGKAASGFSPPCAFQSGPASGQMSASCPVACCCLWCFRSA